MAWPETCVKLHWPIEDPVSQKDFEFARDEIQTKLQMFLEKNNFSAKS